MIPIIFYNVFKNVSLSLSRKLFTVSLCLCVPISTCLEESGIFTIWGITEENNKMWMARKTEDIILNQIYVTKPPENKTFQRRMNKRTEREDRHVHRGQYTQCFPFCFQDCRNTMKTNSGVKTTTSYTCISRAFTYIYSWYTTFSLQNNISLVSRRKWKPERYFKALFRRRKVTIIRIAT